MNSTIDDIALIHQFLEGEDTPLSNGNLMIQANSDSIQLLATCEGVVATIQRVQYTPTISLYTESNYYELIREMLIERHFLPLSIDSQISSGFEQYRSYQIPNGYTMKYTFAKLLWREWRFTWNKQNSTRLRRGILLLIKNNWYPVQDIGFHQGFLILKTLVSSVTVQPDDRLIWLNQTHEPVRAKMGSRVTSSTTQELNAGSVIPLALAAPKTDHHRQRNSSIMSATQSRRSIIGR